MRQSIFFQGFFALFLLSGSSFAEGSSIGEWNIFGVDNRQAITSTQSPWSTIGKLSTGCTGTLVGKDLVLTAAHCVLDEETGKLSSSLYAFYPNQISGSSLHSSGIDRVWWGTGTPNSRRYDDWAIIRLEKNLGDIYGWMGVSPTSSVNRVTLAGYSADFRGGRTAATHIDCSIRLRSLLDVFWLHDCDMTRGASGGPIFYMEGSNPYIVAINVAERRNNGDDSLQVDYYHVDYANIAVPASRFIDTLKQLKR